MIEGTLAEAFGLMGGHIRGWAANDIPCMPNSTHIVPVLVGCPVRAKQAIDTLMQDYGVHVRPINYPTVPKDTERLRLTPSPLHDDALVEIWQRLDLGVREAA